MEELLQSAEGIVALVAASLGGTTGLATLITTIVMQVRNKKYSAMVASSNAKDTQIEELKDMVQQAITVLGLMMSAFATQQLSSMALTPETKKQIISIADKVEKLTNIKLDDAVQKAIDIMTTANPKSITEEEKQQIIETANKAQEVLNTVSEEAGSLADSLDI